MSSTTSEAERKETIPPVFRRLLVNTLVTGVTSSFLWFALTFWVYLETHSVVATAVIGAAFALSSAIFGPAYGTYVDTHRKHSAMVLSTAVSGMVGTVTGISFAVTSVFSGLVIRHLGMGWALYGSLALTVVALFDLVRL